jgi:hypothetical protein
MLIAVTALAMVQAWSLPAAAYMMPELCEKLSQKSGVPHSVDPELQDYPVFLSLRNPTDARVESLVAAALRAEWTKTGNGLRLTPLAPKPDEDFPEFERQLKVAFAGKPFASLPARDLYEMPVGAILRFGQHPTENVLPLPAPMQKMPTVAARMLNSTDPTVVRLARERLKTFPNSSAGAFWRVQRRAYGVFETASSGFDIPQGALFDWNGETQFGSLPPAVQDLLKNDLGIPSGDYLCFWATPALANLGKVVTADLAMALPDSAIKNVSFMDQTRRGNTVKEVLSNFSNCENWIATDGAVVGQIPATETLHRSQARREAMAAFVAAQQIRPFPYMNDRIDYFKAQRPAAVAAGWDSGLLGLVHAAGFGDDFGADWPYNSLLFEKLTSADWAVLRSSKKTSLSALSPAAAAEIKSILLYSDTRMQDSNIDPATWPSLAPTGLTITPKVTETPILLEWDRGRGTPRTGVNAGYNYGYKIPEADPHYQLATYQRVVIKVSNAAGVSIDTGFENNAFDPKAKILAWTDLPAPFLAEFERGKAAATAGKVPAELAKP